MSELRRQFLSKSNPMNISQEDLYKSELEEHLQDMSQAILFTNLQQKLLEASEVMNSTKALKQQRFYNKFSILRKLAFFGLILMSFFETPLWCQEDKYTNTCDYPLNDKTDLIPLSGIPYIPRNWFYVIQIVFLLFLAIQKAMKYRFMYRTSKRNYILVSMFTLVLLSFVDNLVQFCDESYNINATMIICPIFFVLYHGRLRRTIVIFFRVMYKGLPLLFALFFNIFLFAGLGRVLFSRMVENNVFDNFWDASFELLVLQTTSNFPDIMMPFYINSGWAPFFFILFLLINYFLLTNMLLGIFYMFYKNQIQESTKKYFLQQDKIIQQIQKLKKHEKKLEFLRKQSKQLSHSPSHTESDSHSHQSSSYRFKSIEIAEEQIDLIEEAPEYEEQLQSSIKKPSNLIKDFDLSSSKNNIFKSQSRENQESDTMTEAQKQYSENLEKMERRLQIHSKFEAKYQESFGKESFNKPQRNSLNSSRLTAEDVLSVATKQFGLAKQPTHDFQKLKIQNNRWKRYMAAVLRNIYFDIVMGLLSCVSFLIICFDEKGQDTIGDIIYINFSINILFIIETICRLYLIGFKQFFKRYFFIYEGLVSITLQIFFIIFLVNHQLEFWVDLFIIFKLLRFILLLSRINGIEKIFASLFNFLPYFVDMLSVLFIFFYIFSGLGQHIFGGYYRTSAQPLLSPTKYDGYDVPDYIYNNFNDLPNGFILLFELIVVNNWCVNTEVGCAIMGSKMYRLYFILWFILAVILSFNILVAFIIDHLVNEWELQEQHELEELEKKNKENLQDKEINFSNDNISPRHSDDHDHSPDSGNDHHTPTSDNEKSAEKLQLRLQQVGSLVIDKHQQAAKKEKNVKAEYNKQEKYTQMLNEQHKAQLALEKKIEKQQKILEKKLEKQQRELEEGQQLRSNKSLSVWDRKTDTHDQQKGNRNKSDHRLRKTHTLGDNPFEFKLQQQQIQEKEQNLQDIVRQVSSKDLEENNSLNAYKSGESELNKDSDKLNEE